MEWTLVFAGLLAGLGAAPAAPSYIAVERSIQDVRSTWAQPGAPANPNAAGWNGLFDSTLADLRAYSSAQTENDRLVALARLYQTSANLAQVSWPPAVRLRAELRAWLRPRVRLAWAERRLVEITSRPGQSSNATSQANRDAWVKFVNDELGGPLKLLDGASTVAERLEALTKVYGALQALQLANQNRPWAPSSELQGALNDLYNQPNLDVSADLATITPALSNDVVHSGPIYRHGYVSQVTAGPKTGFGLLWSNSGISFYNKQIATSVTPITDFQNQIMQDPQGKRAAKLYYFTATSQDVSEVTIIATLTPNGLQLGPQYAHSVGATIASFKQPGKALGRFIAALIGMNQYKITEKVYEGAIGKIQQNVIREAAELGAEKTAQAQAERNAALARYLIGGDSLAFRNLIINELTLQSRPENALIGGKLHWLGAHEQVGADASQPASLAVPAGGVSADLHLSSIMTSLIRGYLQSDAVRSVDNVMIVTKKVPPDAPPKEAIAISQNADYATFLKSVEATREANDPKVVAVRVKRPSQAPQFAADARGFLVASVPDFQMDVPAPAQAVRGGLAGPPAQVYRFVSPRAEVVISFKIAMQTEKSPVRLTGQVEEFDPGNGAKVFAINQDESKPQQLQPFPSVIALGVLKNKLRGQPINVPLSNLQLRGFAIQEVTALDPSGWIRVNLVRTSSSPRAGIH
jgi:hypothetical protein